MLQGAGGSAGGAVLQGAGGSAGGAVLQGAGGSAGGAVLQGTGGSAGGAVLQGAGGSAGGAVLQGARGSAGGAVLQGAGRAQQGALCCREQGGLSRGRCAAGSGEGSAGGAVLQGVGRAQQEALCCREQGELGRGRFAAGSGEGSSGGAVHQGAGRAQWGALCCRESGVQQGAPCCRERGGLSRGRHAAGSQGGGDSGVICTPQAPEVHVLHSSCTTKPGAIQLLCFISGFYPEPLKVEWLVNGEPGLLHGDTAPAKKDADGRTFITRSNASVSQDVWLEGKTYTCQVSHPETTSPSNIQVFLVPPSPAALYVAQSPMLTCLVVNLPSDSGLQVVWSREKPGSIIPDPLTLTEQFNNTFTASSSMPIFTRDWEAGETFTCKVEHSDLISPLIKSISKKPGKHSAPGVYLLHPHSEELSSKGDSVSVTCLVRGFFPEDISVQWMKNHEGEKETNYITTPPMKDGASDSNFFLYSKLKVSKASWNSGDTYTCMITHEALSLKFTQRSISKISVQLPVNNLCALHDNK
uniref:Ig-like domain-containing protein n=1 Tax=Gopherus evgoodei TaxID=1825980 RepID=A0A8C4YTP6_9SAUR